jgi:glyoxylase-like metal-dependent hydrolase (beta-lactamase superfamily II)
MIIKQYFHTKTGTYTYLIADENSRDALLIDPVKDDIDVYLKVIQQLNLTLRFALDTHIHADHITALGLLKERKNAATYLGLPQQVDCADFGLTDNQMIRLGDLEIRAIHTPGHTAESFCFYISAENVIFTGDTLLIGGTGRTDFQNGDAEKLYDSLHNKILTLPDDTLVYPGHDYNGKHHTTIGHEKLNNPRLANKNKEEFITMMNHLNLPDPEYMHIAVPSNLNCGNEATNASKPKE